MKNSSIKAGITIMAADSMGTAAGKSKSLRTGYIADGSRDPEALGNKGFLLDPPRIDNTSDLADRELGDLTTRSGPDPRHGGRSNFAFCDGSVRKLYAIEAGYAIGPQEEVLPSGNNKFFSGNGEDKLPPSAD